LRAVLLRETGGPDALRVEEVDEPQGTVAAVRAAGVNFADVLMRAGNYPQPPELPAVLGGEISGELDGQRVLALTGGGGYAERVALDPAWTFPLPDGVSFEAGAAFLTTYLTAYIPLTLQARVSSGSTVLVHAGSGGVGTAGIQLAKHLGAHVVATASSEEKREFARAQGADEAFSYEEFAAEVRADVVLDPVGGELVAVSHKVLEPLGVHLLIGFAGGWWQPVDPALLVGRNVSLAGFYLGRLMRFAPELVRVAAVELLELWAAGAVRPVVGATFALDDAAAAHRLIEERKHVGKVVLLP
jgi:NADPH2:quinone reductase